MLSKSIVLSGFVAFSCAQAVPASDASPLKAREVDLDVTVESGRLPHPVLRVLIVNGSENSYWFNKRLLWNGSAASPYFIGELRIEVRSASSPAKMLEFNCKRRVRAAAKSDYVLLHPRGIVGHLVELDCLHLQKGRYVVRVFYKDLEDPGELGGSHPRYDKELVADPVDLTVEP